MRYLVFGDVHGNLVALEAVLAAGLARGVEATLFVGDLIGYGPDPVGCIERLMQFKQTDSFAWVAGNHELALRGDLDATNFNEEAGRTLKWTRQLLAGHPAAMEFLQTGELSIQVNDFIYLTHDSLADPGSGHYHRDTTKAKSELACLRYKGGRICFYGHTHAVRVEVARGDGEIVLPLVESHIGTGYDAHPVRLSSKEIAWVGTGSVGFPLNEKRWPEFLILDDQTWQLEKYAVEYDREAARARAKEVLAPACGDAVAERIARWM